MTLSPPTEAAIHAALARNDIDGAIALAEAELEKGRETPLLLNLAAHRQEVTGRYDAAMRLLDRALSLAPNDPLVHNSLGGVLTKVGRPLDALGQFDEALRLHPTLAVSHHGRGLALAALDDAEGARAAHQHARDLEPAYPEPVGALAALAVEAGDAEAARRLAEEALALDPGQTAALMALAKLALDAGRHEEVIALTDRLFAAGPLTKIHSAMASGLRADALDALGRYDEAFDAYVGANAPLNEVYRGRVDPDYIELGVELCDRLQAHFATTRSAWDTPPSTPAPPHNGVRRHAFLLGFPRSGTTLLEQVLATHEDVSALEERKTLDPIVPTYFGDEAALARLAALDGEELERERAAYWARVDAFGADTSRAVFVDKLPMMTLYLPLVAKLFPDARIIFAIRDPRDVVLSGFRRRFRVNALGVEFTDLERTARLYDGVMRVAKLYRERLPIHIFMARHEALVEDFDGETRRICEFLGLDWTDSLREFAKTAQQRDVRTPSVNQVRRGLYREGMAQWRRYESHLRPILPILEPWVEAYGYAGAEITPAP